MSTGRQVSVLRIELISVAAVLLVVAGWLIFRGFKHGGRSRYVGLFQGMLPITAAAESLKHAGVYPSVMYCIAAITVMQVSALLLTALLFDWFVDWNTEAEIKFVHWAQALLVLSSLVLGVTLAIMGKWLDVWLIAAGCLVGLPLLHLWCRAAKKLIRV